MKSKLDRLARGGLMQNLLRLKVQILNSSNNLVRLPLRSPTALSSCGDLNLCFSKPLFPHTTLI
ncbi:hypothetical protein [Oscillatoria sp. FACHB-1406]|uniref:hypothetical protein n=1 Tax=Oscillatoria sp. FACHB-1406 TaxID=2692846 RepID=UPI001681C5F0|nr:hypothetical protein [Oscillatoria sp. FACHB-1406]MBD2578149.1 hypothetical protein [Oscillatoria sp. FACHB-1406]